MDQGQRVVGLGRSSQSTLDGNVAYLAGDRSDTSFVRRVVADQKIEVVVDVIPMTTFETRPLLESLDGTIRQYVMISSSDVYANYELLHKRSHGNPTQSALDEESPLRSTAFPYREPVPRATDAGDRYLDDYDKIPIEAAVQHLSSAWTVLRLPMVYGPGDKQRRFRWAIAPMVRGDETLTVPRDWANWRSTYGYVENVGAAIAITVGDASAENRIFNIAEARPVSQLEWARKFAHTLGWSGTIELTDDPHDLFAARLSGLDLTVPFNINGQRIRDIVGFSEVVDEPTALARTIQSEITQ